MIRCKKRRVLNPSILTNYKNYIKGNNNVRDNELKVDNTLPLTLIDKNLIGIDLETLPSFLANYFRRGCFQWIDFLRN